MVGQTFGHAPNNAPVHFEGGNRTVLVVDSGHNQPDNYCTITIRWRFDVLVVSSLHQGMGSDVLWCTRCHDRHSVGRSRLLVESCDGAATSVPAA